MMTRVDRIGVDVGTPADAAALAATARETGAAMVRVRFALGGWTEPDDGFIAAARSAIVAVRAAGLQVLGVIDSDLTVAPEGMGAFAAGPQGALAVAWASEMSENAARVSAALADLVDVWEVLPDPNRGDPPRIAPDRWAALVAEVAARVRQAAPGAVVVSGGLVSDDADDAVDYLTAALRAAAEARLWAPGALPIDGLGIRLGVLGDGGTSGDMVAAIVAERARRLWRVLERFEGTAAAEACGIYVTGIGWDAAKVGEDIQARNVWAALNALTSDAKVYTVIWQGLVDAPAGGAMGLFRGTSTAPMDRRWAWNAFSDFAAYARQITPAAGAEALLAGVDTAAHVEPPSRVPAPAEPEPVEPGWSEPAALVHPAAEPGGPELDVNEAPVDVAAAAPGVVAPVASEMAMADGDFDSPGWTETGADELEAGEVEISTVEIAAVDAEPTWVEPVAATPETVEAGAEPAWDEPAAAASEAVEPVAVEPEPIDAEASWVEPVAEESEAVDVEPMWDEPVAAESEAVDAEPVWVEPVAVEPETVHAEASWVETPIGASTAPTTIEPPVAEAPAGAPVAPATVEPAAGIDAAAHVEPPPAGPALGLPAAALAPVLPTAQPPEDTEVVDFRIPDAAEVLRAAGIDGARLAAVLDAVRQKYGDPAWLPAGDYHVSLRPSAPAPAAPPAAYTNQQVISALYRAGGGTWDVFERSGLKLGDMAARRTQAYAGPAVADMAGLSPDERDVVAHELAALVASAR